MKLNEKHLVAFATGSAPVDKEGYLYKRGEVNKSFQKRWFVLKGNLLFYLEKKSDKEPLGVLILEGCTVELSESNDAFTFELVFEGSGSRVYVLSAETQEEMEDWMKAIACAGYDFMKLMVAELQRQMDDLTSNKSDESSQPQRPAPGPPIPPRPRAADPDPVLIDLGSSPSASPQLQHRSASPQPPPRQGSRKNPFDMFGATPLDVALQNHGNTDPKSRTRSFIEMHKDFGEYIHKKVDEYKRCTGRLS